MTTHLNRRTLLDDASRAITTRIRTIDEETVPVGEALDHILDELIDDHTTDPGEVAEQLRAVVARGLDAARDIWASLMDPWDVSDQYARQEFTPEEAARLRLQRAGEPTGDVDQDRLDAFLDSVILGEYVGALPDAARRQATA